LDKNLINNGKVSAFTVIHTSARIPFIEYPHGSKR